MAADAATAAITRQDPPRAQAGRERSVTSRDRRRGLSRRARNAVLTLHIAAAVAILGGAA